jgi:hypothetical protein
MKNFRNAFLVTAALVLGFTSCNKDEMSVPADGTKTVSFKISGSATPTPKAAGVKATGKIKFNNGVLYFHDGTIIIRAFTISDGVTSSSNININEITSGAPHTITDLPSSVTHATVVGNTSTPLSGTIASVRAHSLDMASQMHIDNAVHLFGTDALTAIGGSLYEAAVHITPIVARFEVGAISAGDVRGRQNHITAFTVDAIFFDNYHATASADGTTRGTLVSGNPSVAYFAAGSVPYANDAFHNWDLVNSLGTAPDDLQVKPTLPATVWGYNTFAGTGQTGNRSMDIPYIIIRLSDVVVSYDEGVTSDDTTYAGPQFITIRGFRDNNVAIQEIIAGNVYTIEDIVFTEQDLRPTPKEELIDVEVTVTVAEWSPVKVEPII